MKRIYLSLLMVAALGVGLFVATRTNAQAPGAAPTAQRPRECGVFNMAKVQKEFKKWDAYTKELQALRTNEAKKLGDIQSLVADLKKQLESPTTTNKDAVEKQLVALSRQFQDTEAEVRKKIDKASTDYLMVLHDDIQLAVKAVAESNNLGVVVAYADATTEEERKSPLYFDMKLRPTAAMPFYVHPSCDMTDTIIQTLNIHRPPVSGTGLSAVGGTAPAQPTQPK